MQNALKRITGEKINLTASGRTDAGVHAEAQVANFKTHSKIPLKNLQMALNSGLSKDIVVTHMREVPLKFDSQRCAKSKIYRYTIVNNDFMNPFLRRFAAKCYYKLDIFMMKKAAKMLSGRHDFVSFKTNDGREDDTIRTVKMIKIEREGDIVYIYIEADGFLYNMARNIVGTLIEVGRGKIKAEIVGEILGQGIGGPAALRFLRRDYVW